MIKKTVACEYVGFGHPDKVADQVSDALLDEFLKQDPNTRAGIEVMVKDNIVVLGGEVNSKAKIDYDSTVRNVFAQLPYPKSHHLTPDEIKIINLIGKQSPEISKGVDQESGEIGAGDQGFMVGFASNETSDYMPIGMHIARKICRYISRQTDRTLGPDCKSQTVTVYQEDGEVYIESVLVSTMHQNSLEEVREVVTRIIENNEVGFREPFFEKYFNNNGHKPKIIVNPCGEWNIGGSVSDCGITGRKIVCDQFGGYAPVGGGNLHGKDMSKVDRSSAYMARYLAKNIVAAGLADQAKVELSYQIGVANPSSINIELNRNQSCTESLINWIRKHVDITPAGIIKRFDGGYPRYYNTAKNGHYGLSDKVMEDEEMAKLYPWEKTDIAEQMKEII